MLFVEKSTNPPVFPHAGGHFSTFCSEDVHSCGSVGFLWYLASVGAVIVVCVSLQFVQKERCVCVAQVGCGNGFSGARVCV